MSAAQTYHPGGSYTVEMAHLKAAEGFYSLRDAARDGILLDILQSTITTPGDPPPDHVDLSAETIEADTPMIVYRAVPIDAPRELLPGQFVTASRSYAEWHGSQRLMQEFGFVDYRIDKHWVAPSELETDGVTPHDFLFLPGS